MAFLLFLLFTLIGIGPALGIRRARIGDLKSWLLAPAVGFVLIAIAVTVLVDCQQPIERFGTVLAIVAVVVSLALVGWAWRKGASGVAAADRSEMGWALAAVLVGCLLVSLPVQMGGRWFNHMRGNGWDSYNYVTAAGALVHEPMGWINSNENTTLAERRSSYPNARKLLNERWTTMAILGWASVVTHVSLFDIEPAFGVMHLMLALGVTLLLARYLGAGPRWAAVIAIVVGAGFWSQFSLDLRSLSQLNSWPIVMMLLALWPEASAETSWNPLSRNRVLVTLGSCALAICYIEFVPMFVLGAILGWGLRWFWDRRNLAQLGSEAVAVVAGLGVAVGLAPVLLGFMNRQARLVTVSSATAQWLNTQHGWLVSHPYTGLWGLSHLDALVPGWWTSALGLLTAILACVLSGLLLTQLVVAVTGRAMSAADRMLAGLVIAGIMQAAGLFSIGQYWATVKAVGYVAPLCLFACITWWVGSGGTVWRGNPARVVFAAAAGLLVFSQGWAAMLRIVLVAERSDYLSYIYHLPNYGTRDLDLGPIRDALAKGWNEARVGLMVPDVWLSRMVRLDLGFDHKLVEPLGVTDVDDHTRINPPIATGKVDFWIWQKESLPGNVTDKDIVAKTSDFVLTRSVPFVIDIANPSNGVEQDPSTGTPLTWIGTEAVTFRVNAPAAGTAFLVGRFIPGNSIKSTQDRHLEIFGDGFDGMRNQTANAATMEIPFPVKAGINTVKMDCTDKVEVIEQPNGDHRPLMLEVVGPQLRFAE